MPTNVSPRRKGGSAARPPDHLLRSRGGFHVQRQNRGAAGAPRRALLVAPGRRRRSSSPDGVPGHDHGRERQRHDREAADADRVALADRDRGSVRDRRRAAGRRRRRLSRTTRRARRGRSSPASRRTSRRSPATSPTSSSSDSEAGVARLAPGWASPCCSSAGGATSRQAYAQIRQLGQATGHTKQAHGRRPLDAEADRRGAPLDPGPRRGSSTVYHELTTRLLLGDVEDVHRPRLHAARPEQHRRRSRQAGPATRSSRRSTSSPRTRT